MTSTENKADYIYDIYIEGIEGGLDYNEPEEVDEEVSSNDENYDGNDYPDEDSVLEDGVDFYGDWRYDEEYEDEDMLRRIGRFYLSYSESESDDDYDY